MSAVTSYSMRAKPKGCMRLPMRAVCRYSMSALSIQHWLGCINWFVSHSCNKYKCGVWVLPLGQVVVSCTTGK